MQSYLNLLKEIYDNGKPRLFRNGNRYGLVGLSLRHNFKHGFPLLTTKTINYKTAFAETLMFIKGISHTGYLEDLKDEGVVNIWKKWELKSDDIDGGIIGPMYGQLWRNFPSANGTGTIDQLASVIDNIKRIPYSTRHYVSAFHPSFKADDLKTPQQNVIDGNGCLNPCHPSFQFIVTVGDNGNNALSIVFNMTSSDVPVGLPYNIAGYALLLTLVALEVNMEIGELVYHGGDCHIYENQMHKVTEQLMRVPYTLPTIRVENFTDIWSVKLSDIVVENYTCWPHLAYPVS